MSAKDWTRRQLLKFFMSGAAGVAASPFLNILPVANAQSNPNRRHFVNIEGIGGIDVCWTFNGIKEADHKNSSSAKGNFYGYCSGNTGSHDPNNPYNSVRYADSDIIVHKGANLGPVMAIFSPAELDEFFIWRGVKPTGGHFIGNGYIQNGHQSPYAIGYSLLISDAMAKSDYMRPLHHAQTVAMPKDLYIQDAMYKGDVSVVNLPDRETWKRLTEPTNDVYKSSAQNDQLTEAIQKLSNQPNRFRSPASHNVSASKFYGAFFDSQKIMGRDYANSSVYGFQALVQQYVDNLLDDLYFLVNKPNSPVKKTLESHGRVTSFTDRASCLEQLKRIGTNVEDLVFPFALAEFLIKYDLSATVDIRCPSGDHHQDNASDLFHSIETMSMWKTMMKNLKATGAGDGTGRSLFDLTGFVMTHEFDRWTSRGTENPSSRNPGTGHGVTTTFVLAGYGVNGGKVVGHRMTGPGGYLDGVITGVSEMQPVPLNRATGAPDQNGHIFGQMELLPTLAKIYDAPIPAQQNNGYIPFDFAIKKVT